MNLLKILLDLIIVVLAALAITIGVMRIQGFKAVVIESDSMKPTFKVNSVVVIKPVDFDELSKGDIVTFINSSGAKVTHRIMAVDGENKELITKGDSNEWLDISPVSEDQIVGKVYFKIPYSDSVVSKYNEIKDKINKKG